MTIAGAHSTLENDFYVPTEWRKQSSDNKQASAGVIEPEADAELLALLVQHYDRSYVLYEKAKYRLPVDLKIGDRLEIRATGAYTSTYASVAFNGFEPLRCYCI